MCNLWRCKSAPQLIKCRLYTQWEYRGIFYSKLHIHLPAVQGRAALYTKCCCLTVVAGWLAGWSSHSETGFSDARPLSQGAIGNVVSPDSVAHIDHTALAVDWQNRQNGASSTDRPRSQYRVSVVSFFSLQWPPYPVTAAIHRIEKNY